MSAAPTARRWALPAPALLARVLVGLVIACYVLLLRDFLHFADRAPYVAVDDALANVSLAVGHLGRFGFPASPIQAMTDTARNDVMVNYGPWPFLAGAALDWMFGSSYLVQRALHPLGLALLALVALRSLRSRSLAAGALFAWMLAEVYRRGHWPMVRPDIGAAVFGGLLIAALGAALASGRRRWWFVAGFCASGAAVTHQVAWSLVPASVTACWLGIPLLEASAAGGRLRSVVRASAALLCGGLFGALLYFVAIDFRVEELVALWRAYGAFLGERSEQGYWAVLGRHVGIWGSVPRPARVLAAAALLAAVGLLACAPRQGPALRRKLVSLLLPPLLVGFGYTASLGLYSNWHSGYSMLAQVGLLWSIAAALAGGIQFCEERRPVWGGHLESGVRALALITLLAFCGNALRTPSVWALTAVQNVSISEFHREVVSDIPAAVPVWGPVALGLESGVRTNLVDMMPGLTLLQDFQPQARTALLPEYLIVGGTLLNDMTMQGVSGNHVNAILSAISQLADEARYELWSLVSASPYGTARVYRRGGQPERAPLPRVALYSAQTESWSRRLAEPIAVSARAVDPVEFQLRSGRSLNARADRSQVTQLEAGAYLVQIALKMPAPGSGLLLLSSGNPTVAQAGDLPFAMAQAPYFADEPRVALLVEHTGGPLYISQFDANPQAGFRLDEVRPLLGPAEGVPVIVPPPADWTVFASTAELRPLADAQIEVVGDATSAGYQLQSPPFSVPRESLLYISAPLQFLGGSAGLGVLSGDASLWLRSPELGARAFEFHNTDQTSIRLVIANVNSDGAQPSRFRLGEVRVSAFSTGGFSGLYVDALARCRRAGPPPLPGECLRVDAPVVRLAPEPAALAAASARD